MQSPILANPMIESKIPWHGPSVLAAMHRRGDRARDRERADRAELEPPGNLLRVGPAVLLRARAPAGSARCKSQSRNPLFMLTVNSRLSAIHWNLILQYRRKQAGNAFLPCNHTHFRDSDPLASGPFRRIWSRCSKLSSVRVPLLVLAQHPFLVDSLGKHRAPR